MINVTLLKCCGHAIRTTKQNIFLFIYIVTYIRYMGYCILFFYLGLMPLYDDDSSDADFPKQYTLFTRYVYNTESTINMTAIQIVIIIQQHNTIKWNQWEWMNGGFDWFNTLNECIEINWTKICRVTCTIWCS